MRNPLNRELVATFEIIVSVHDNASEVIDKSGSVPNGKSRLGSSSDSVQQPPHLLMVKMCNRFKINLFFLLL